MRNMEEVSQPENKRHENLIGKGVGNVGMRVLRISLSAHLAVHGV